MLRSGSRVSVLAKAVPSPVASVLHLASLIYTSIFSQAFTDRQDLEVKLWTWQNKETKACLMLNKERFHIITCVLRGNDRLLAVCEYMPLSQVSVQQETNLKQVGSCPSAQSTFLCRGIATGRETCLTYQCINELSELKVTDTGPPKSFWAF